MAKLTINERLIWLEALAGRPFSMTVRKATGPLVLLSPRNLARHPPLTAGC